MMTMSGGAALAGGGNGNSANAPGQEKKADAQQPAPQAQQPSTQSQPGVKPSSTTSKNTDSKVGANPDKSKRYGNGKTAAQIAKSRGANDDVNLHGPGNSQPHKVCGRDVHAVKSYNADGSVNCDKTKPAQTTSNEHEKITICHATGSSTNPYVVITIDKHGLNGHGGHDGDIIPAPAAGCPKAETPQVQPVVPVTTTTSTQTCPAGTETKTVTRQVTDGIWHKTGNGWVLIHPNEGSAHYDASKHEDDRPNVVTITETVQVTTAANCEQHTTTTATQTTPTTAVAPTIVGNASGALPATQGLPSVQQSGGVLGAQTTLASPKPAKRGVLGTVTQVAGSSLPFTGFPVWVAVLIALALLAAGLMLRRRGSAARL
jgi:hypothetical protein